MINELSFYSIHSGFPEETAEKFKNIDHLKDDPKR
jgi:hypothetical protein